MARIGGNIGGEGGSGWVLIGDVTVPGGVADLKVYQDEAETVLQSCRVSGYGVELAVRSSFPVVSVAGVFTQLAPVGGSHYAGTVTLTLTGSAVVTVKAQTPNGANGAEDTVDLTYDPPPTLLSLSFSGGYPGAQTELKAGDTFELTGTTDKAADAIDIQDFGAMVASLETFVAGTSFTVTGTIADRGNAAQLLSAKARARDAASGAMGPERDTNLGGGNVDGVDVVTLNNLHPMVVWGAVTYPATQGALKASESATVGFSMANADGVAFTSPTGELNVTNPTTAEDPKTVTRIAGSYNDATPNLRAVATRDANAAQTTADTLVKVANVAPVLTVTVPALRLRSGGGNGTAPQDHVITLTSTQELGADPGMEPFAGAGAWEGAWAGGPKVWTRSLRVLDTDLKGTYGWDAVNAVNLAGIAATVITTGPLYTLGGFVPRTLYFGAFQQNTVLAATVVDYNKLVADYFTATNQPATRTAAQGDLANYGNKFTVTALGALPTTLWWNDVTAAMTNGSGLAAIVGVEETV